MKIWFYEKINNTNDLLGIWDNVPTIPRIGEKVEILKRIRTVTDIKYTKNGNKFHVEILIS
ncbi:Protein of unknown function [Bacillus sp. 491mf]|uniref:DUF3913 family protein n=1 Tax=Bacillus TaxID=1386 RepID=UPI00054EA7F1|nr:MULTISPECIES: DUF3913 family protein [unclassified Bacillus (in: firmicutes)]SFC12392.1 Protein of unknown function [Bacillus sp. 491mf]